MKRIILLLLMVFAWSVSAEMVSILFDQNGEKRDALSMKPSAKIIKGKAFSGDKMLEISGENDNNQYAVSFEPLLVKAGEKIGFSCVYKSSSKFTSGHIVCFYKDKDNKLIESRTVRLFRHLDWERVEHIFTVPDNPVIEKAVVCIRLVKVPETEKLYVDNLRCGKLNDETAFRCSELKDIVFRDWRSSTPVQERFIPGPGGRVFRDWQAAKLGEACYQVVGNGHAYQYPLTISLLKIRPGANYIFSFDYRTEGPYTSNNGMFIVFFRDANGKMIKAQSRLSLLDSKSWTRRELIFSPPPKAEFADIRLRLYKQSPNAKMYVDDIDFEEGRASLRLVWKINPDTKKLSGSTELLSAKAVKPVKVLLKDANGKEITTIKCASKEKFEINLALLPDGKYTIFALLETENGTLKSGIGSFHNYNKCTWKNNIGILAEKDDPPRPWKPLKYDQGKNTVTTWNSVISFNRMLEITDLKLNKPELKIFRIPPRLSLNGKEVKSMFKAGEVRLSGSSPNHITLENTLSSDTLDILVNARVEYDGFVKYNLTLKAKSDTAVDNLKLHYSPVIMDWQVCYDGSWSNYRLIDLRDKKKMTSERFYPLIWNGNTEAGVYWCAEQLYPAAEIMPKICQSAEVNKGVDIDIVCAPLKLAPGKERVFEYGFGSTPVRPRRAEGRNLRFRAGKYSNMDMAWSNPNNMKYFGFPEAAEPDVFPEYLKRNKHKLTFFYQCPSFAMTSIPQWKYYEQKWTSLPLRIYPAKTSMKKWGYDDVKINQQERTWTDLYMKHFRKFLTEHKFGGVYYDCMNVYPDKKVKEFKYRVFALRDFYSRIYAEQVRLNPDTWFFLHSGATFFTIASIFADISLTGEEYRAECMEHDFYLEFLTPEEFRIQMCTNTGAWRMFLPQYRNERSEKPEVAVHAVGLTMVYNIMLYPSFIVRKYVDRMQNRKYAFIDAGGQDKWKFVPYWENNPSDNKKILCSSYVNSKGQFLACINSTDKAQKFKVKIPGGNSLMHIYDPLTDKIDTVNAESIIELKPYMVKMILAADIKIWNN